MKNENSVRGYFSNNMERNDKTYIKIYISWETSYMYVARFSVLPIMGSPGKQAILAKSNLQQSNFIT